MKADDALAAAPIIALALAGLAALVLVSFAKRKAAAAFAAGALGLAVALAALGLGLPLLPRGLAGLLAMDALSFFGTAIVLVCALAIALASRPYLARREGERGEYFVLVLFAALGAAVLAASSNLATLFLGLELLSVSLYALVAYRRERAEGTKAAFTYLILASAASAFLLFGMALAYYRTGSLDLLRITRAAEDGSDRGLFIASLALMGVGFAFKLAVVPFHLWALEVYEGASAPVTALIATLSKAAMAIPLIRVLMPAGISPSGISPAAAGPAFAWTLAGLAGASMIAGNLLALREEKIKRMLAGSSIAQVGYILVALAAGGGHGAGAALFYLAAYCLSTLGAFVCIVAISPSDRDAERGDFSGLAARRPFVAAAMTASLLSLAGMPLTAGFIGKFMLFSAGAFQAGPATPVLAVLLALNSAASLFYYLRLVSVMFRNGESTVVGVVSGALSDGGSAARGASFLFGSLLALIVLAIVVLGAAPGPLLEFVASISGR